jgi:hypothetical protein
MGALGFTFISPEELKAMMTGIEAELTVAGDD